MSIVVPLSNTLVWYDAHWILMVCKHFPWHLTVTAKYQQPVIKFMTEKNSSWWMQFFVDQRNWDYVVDK